MRKINLLTIFCLIITQLSLAQGSIDIDTNIQMGVFGTEHVKITSSAFSVHNGAGGTPLIYGDFGSGKVGIGTTSPNQMLEVSGHVFSNGGNFNVNDNFGYTWGNTTTAIYGNNASHYIYFRTNSQERLRIDASGNVGIGKSSPITQLHLYKGSASSSYPTITSRGDIMQLFESSNNAIEIGNARGVNARRAWILARHSSMSYGRYYSTLHLQPDIGTKSDYRGVAIGYSGSTAVSIGTHLAVNGKVGIGTTAPGYNLQVTGSAGKTGGGSWSNTSDRRLKKNITAVQNFLVEIQKLNPVKYEWINPDLHGGRLWEMGFIAQEVEEHFPEWIKENDPQGEDITLIPSGEKAKNLTLPFDFDALVVSSIKELNAKVVLLEKENNELRTLNTKLRSEVGEVKKQNQEVRVKNEELRSEIESSARHLQSQIDKIINQKKNVIPAKAGISQVQNSKT